MKLQSLIVFLTLWAFVLVGCAPPRVGLYKPGSGPGGGVNITLDEAPPTPPKKQPTLKAKEPPSPVGDPPLPIPSPDGPTGKVTTVKKGQLAPYAGTLLSPEAAARLMARLEYADDRTLAEVKRAVDEASAQHQLQLQQKQIALDAEKKKREVQVRLRDDHISDLNEQLAKEKDDMIWLWVGGGALGGALITILGAVVAGQVSR